MKLTCGECNKQFEAEQLTDFDYWVCPHCDTVLQEPES